MSIQAVIDKIETQFRESIFGQDQFLHAVTSVIRRDSYFRNHTHQPIACFYLAGPTGTGKTCAVETFARALHQKPSTAPAPMILVNCGEYQLEHEIAKLLGAPPGYIGHRETTPVITMIKLSQVMSDASNTAIILFDEFEKASPALRDLLLGIMAGTQLQLGDGIKVGFGRCIIFFTSNLGAEALRNRQIGILPTQRRRATTIDWAELVRRRTSAEFVGRMTAFIPFEHLSRDVHARILDRTIGEIRNHAIQLSMDGGSNLDFYSTTATFTRPARRLLLDRLQESPTGARNLIRSVAQLLEEAYIEDYERRQSRAVCPTGLKFIRVGVRTVVKVLGERNK